MLSNQEVSRVNSGKGLYGRLIITNHHSIYLPHLPQHTKEHATRTAWNWSGHGNICRSNPQEVVASQTRRQTSRTIRLQPPVSVEVMWGCYGGSYLDNVVQGLLQLQRRRVRLVGWREANHRRCQCPWGRPFRNVSYRTPRKLN